LPPELIHSISKFLTPIEYYRCLFVSQFWYRTFKQFLYRRIFIHSDEQLEKLVESLQSSPGSKDKEQSSNGLLIRELCLAQKSLSCEENPVKISTDVLSLIGELCSNLEVFTFDITNWQHLQLTTKLIEDLRWKHLRKFAPIPHTIFDIIPASTLAKSNLTHLHLSSSLVPWKCLLEKLKTIPTISHLALEIDYNSGQQQEDALIRMHLQEISYSLPLLEGLKLIRRKVSRSQAPFSSEIPFNLTQLLQPSQLKSLSLEGLVDDLYWFEFICKSYPLLKSLSLAQSGSNTLDSKWRWQGAFLLMIRNLPKLKSLFLCGANAMNLLSDGLGHELRKKECSIDSLAVKSNTYQRMDSCQLLFLIAKHGYRQLKYLRLAVWEDMPGWSSAPYSLLRCTQLVELDLAFSRGISSQYPYTPFLIDRWLSHLPQLERLTLRGVKLQVEYNSFDDLDKSNKSFALKSLKLQLSKIENHEVVLRYISFCCLQLEDLAFLEC
ncbi:hypothetical protein BDF20DRAFT_806707, partial [Mycotypha africana]|uniref:uncharacterized protein n=1 Tax=Mycotypha africana TaxID=64632 RepID=UPI0023017F07